MRWSASTITAPMCCAALLQWWIRWHCKAGRMSCPPSAASARWTAAAQLAVRRPASAPPAAGPTLSNCGSACVRKHMHNPEQRHPCQTELACRHFCIMQCIQDRLRCKLAQMRPCTRLCNINKVHCREAPGPGLPDDSCTSHPVSNNQSACCSHCAVNIYAFLLRHVPGIISAR